MAVNKIQKFIEDNELDFTGSGSDLNSNCCSLSGYALHLGLSYEELEAELTPDQQENSWELNRVFNFAEDHNYGDWWKSEEAKKQYKF